VAVGEAAAAAGVGDAAADRARRMVELNARGRRLRGPLAAVRLLTDLDAL
jgi:hypothetical protein